MAMVTCPNCGHPNADMAKFCAKCGNKLTPAETLVMGAVDDSAPLPPARPPVISAKEQAAFDAPVTGPGAMPPPRPASASAPAYTPPSYTPPAYTPPPAVVPPLASGPAIAPATAGGHRFVAMRTIAGLANILAIVSAVLGFLGGLGWGYILGTNILGGAIAGVLIGLIIGAIAGGLGWVYWRLLGEGIWVILDIEANTRRSAVALEEGRL